MSSPNGRIKRRHVFFLDGFDPSGAAKHHALYQSEAAKQSSLTGTETQVSPRSRLDNKNSVWTVNTTDTAGNRCETRYEYMRWDDIVRKNWQRGIWEQVSGFMTYARMGGIRGIWTVHKTTPKTLVGLWYPAAVLGGGLVLSLLLGLCAALLVSWMNAGWLPAAAAGLVVLMTGLWVTRKIDAKYNTTWLVRIFNFTARHAGGKLPELDQRIDDLAAQISQKIRLNDVDEVLVVGFSVGSLLAVSSMARALEHLESDAEPGTTAPSRPAVSLLTLANCLPMLGMLPGAARFRDELASLVQRDFLTWTDFSSPADWGSFALIDPIAICNIQLAENSGKNLVLRSPRFHTMFTPERYAVVNRDKWRMHMQYMMAAEVASRYDYFAITAGSQPLAVYQANS